MILLASLSGCAHNKPIPNWDGKIWAGDASRASIRRAQAGEEIPASDPRFDSYVAISYDDFTSFYSTYVLGCEKWKKGLTMMSAQEANARLQLFMLDLQRAAEAEKRHEQE